MSPYRHVKWFTRRNNSETSHNDKTEQHDRPSQFEPATSLLSRKSGVTSHRTEESHGCTDPPRNEQDVEHLILYATGDKVWNIKNIEEEKTYRRDCRDQCHDCVCSSRHGLRRIARLLHVEIPLP